MVKNMNTTLSVEVVTDGEFEFAADAIESLNKNGFLGKYKRFSNGFHYCYSKADNKMYLVDEEDIIIDSSLTKEFDSGGIDSSKNEFAPVLVTKLTNKLK